MLGLNVICPYRVPERRQLAPSRSCAGDETLDHWTEERPGAAGWLHKAQLGQVKVSGIPSEIEQYFNYPPAREHSAVVLGS
jgi:hypothetical protein